MRVPAGLFEGQEGRLSYTPEKDDRLSEDGKVRINPGFTKPASQAASVKSFSEPSAGSQVRHKAFGVGIVTALNKENRHLHVEFDGTERVFLFPDAFQQGFLEHA